MKMSRDSKPHQKQSWKKLQDLGSHSLHPRKTVARPTGNDVRGTHQAERSNPPHGGRHN